MFRRLLAVSALLAVLVILAVRHFVPMPIGEPRVLAQGEARPSPSLPKTPWGEPNLQGIWTDIYQTPLQRPARYANREFFPEEERQRLDEGRMRIPRADDRVA